MTLSTNQDNILEGIPLQEENATDDERSLGLPTLRRLDNEEGIEDEEEQNEDLPTLNGGVQSDASVHLGPKVVILRGSSDSLGERLCARGVTGNTCCVRQVTDCAKSHSAREEKVALEEGVYLRTGKDKMDISKIFPLDVLEVLDERELLESTQAKWVIREQLNDALDRVNGLEQEENGTDEETEDEEEQGVLETFKTLDAMVIGSDAGEGASLEGFYTDITTKLSRLASQLKKQGEHLLEVSQANDSREEEYTRINNRLGSFVRDITSDVGKLTRKNNNLWGYSQQLGTLMNKLSAGNNVSSTSNETAILQKLDALECKVQSLESSDKDGTFVFGAEVISSWKDIHAKIDQISGTVSHGAFSDAITILEELQRTLKDSSPSHEDFAKFRNELDKAQLTEEENAREKSVQHATPIPEIFGRPSNRNKKAVKSKSELAGVSSYSDFRDKTEETGVAYDLSKHLTDSSNARRYAIESCYGEQDLLFFKTLSTEVLQKSEDFLRKLVAWVDDTFDTLVNRGQSEEDVWHLISKILKAIFEDIHRSRKLVTLQTRSGHDVRAAQVIYSTLICVKICETYTKMGIKNHPSVTGTSNNWLITNSGRKEAHAAVKKAEALELKHKDLLVKYSSMEKELGNAKKDATVAKSLAEKLKEELGNVKREATTAKSTADKALAKCK